MMKQEELISVDTLETITRFSWCITFWRRQIYGGHWKGVFHDMNDPISNAPDKNNRTKAATPLIKIYPVSEDLMQFNVEIN
jgi:hypothetical protein